MISSCLNLVFGFITKPKNCLIESKNASQDNTLILCETWFYLNGLGVFRESGKKHLLNEFAQTHTYARVKKPDTKYKHPASHY